MPTCSRCGATLCRARRKPCATCAPPRRVRDARSNNISFRPIIGRTEKESWASAEHIYATAQKPLQESGYTFGLPKLQSVGAQHLLAAANESDRHDKVL
ncbi:alkanesulfonate monooxygenase|nr:alkanesulfonate monooxygenase [Candidatus Pantoea persica]